MRKTAHLVLLNTKYDYLLVKIGGCHFENYDSKLASLSQSHILIFLSCFKCCPTRSQQLQIQLFSSVQSEVQIYLQLIFM